MAISKIAPTVIDSNLLGILSSLFGTVLCITGYVLKDVFFEFNKAFRRKHLLLGGFTFLFLILVWITNGSTNMRTVEYNNIMLYYIGAMAGSIFIFCVSVFIVKYFA